MALAGTGGDELCGGSTSFTELPVTIRWSKRLSALPSSVRRVTVRDVLRATLSRAQRVLPQTRRGKLEDLLSTRGDLVDAYQVLNGKFTTRFVDRAFSEFDHEAVAYG